MGPLSSVLSTVNLFAVIDNLYRGIKFVRMTSQDPRSNGLYIRLINEKARFAEWKRRMNVESSDDLRNMMQKLPANAREALGIILQPMEKYMEEAETLVKKYGVDTPYTSDRKQSFSYKLKRINLLIDGQRQLEDLLSTLKNCNDGLLTIAPPAPGYQVSLAGKDQILETSQDAQFSGLDAFHRPQPLQSASQPLATSRQTGKTAAQPRMIAASEAAIPEPSPAVKVFYPVIELLYSTCLSILRRIVVQYPAQKSSFQDIAHRLSVWGSRLFRGKVSLDQVLDQRSNAVVLLRLNISGTLADAAVILGYVLPILGDSNHSPMTLQLKELFSFSEIADLPLQSLSPVDEPENETEASALLAQWTTELAGLIESLFSTLSTTELVFKTVLACQIENATTDERDMTLIKSDSKVSLSNIKSDSTRELLNVDLELIAAMQESLKDSKYAKYIEHRNPKFNAKQLYDELAEESHQIKYWASKLEGSDGQPMTIETQTAMMLNLARVARAFELGFKSAKRDKELDAKTKTTLQRCLKDFPELEAVLQAPLTSSADEADTDTDAAVDVLRSSHRELRRLAGSKSPGLSYRNDFTLGYKAQMLTEERAGISTVLSN